ncbi:MAG: hypothetical protein JXB49_29840 [Bacteroidales bacterium]|nr:hypothetical protein [Bacteroidales bacterium]
MESAITIKENKRPDIWRQDLCNYKYSLFMLPEWIEAINNEYFEPLYIDFYINNEIVGKIGGLFRNSKSLFQRKLFFYSTPAVKIELSDNNITKFCIKSLIKYAKSKKINRLVICSYDLSIPFEKGEICGYGKCKRVEFIVNLDLNKEEIQKNISRNIKRHI